MQVSKDDERQGATRDGEISKKASNQTPNENKENGPLRSHRDPRRTPLLSRIPFTPTPNITSAGGGPSGVRGRKDVTPAYAYKNAETGLLEIRSVIPPSLSMVANEDETVDGMDADDKLCGKRLALYPIALNGGGAGLYRDPREFAKGNTGFSNNHRISRRAPIMSHVRFAWPYEIKQFAGAQLHNRDIETGLSHPPVGEADEDDRTHRTRRSLGSLASAINPWKVWENIHIEMSRMAALQAQRLEDEASHVTIARQRNKASRVSSVYNDDDFDFALVLTPHDAYAFWAKHLDFREEMLHLVDDQDPEIEELDRDGQDDDSTIATATCHGAKSQENGHAIRSSTTQTPYGSGLRRRKNATPTSGSNNITRLSATNNTPSSTSRYQSHRSPYRAPQIAERVFSRKKSLFERALERFSPPGLSQRSLLSNDNIKGKASPSPSINNRSSPSIQRRGWGNFASPPIASQRGGSSQKRRQVSSVQWRMHGSGTRVSQVDSSDKRVDGVRHSSIKTSSKRPRDVGDGDDADDIKDREDTFFPSPGIPRGVAARVNGLGKFIEALKIGIVLRRHWPKEKSVFVMLSSDDGGDSIQFKYIPDDEATIALKEQAQRYNVCRRQKKARLSCGESESRRMSRESETTNQNNDKLDASVPIPDYLKVKIDREEDMRKKGGFVNAISNNVLYRKNDLSIEAKDIVQVQPATHIDPFSKVDEELGTSSLRQSNTAYENRKTFSVILPSLQGRLVRDYSDIDLSEKWCEGKRKSLFHSLDLETATEGEYWMILKGFILLHRDASTGRFAAQRAAGFGSYHRYAEAIDKSAADCGTKCFTEALPPPKTFIQRLIRKNDDEQAPAVQYNGSVPPSDYFLGFSSPGTQIWGRLRQAGLETQRLYSLDTRKVMIKVRCPVDRLKDVAEALKMKLKTKDGEYLPFREDMISQFASTDDGFVSCENDVQKLVSLFRSSERQKIIDFIIGSRIRDSGAELGLSTKLGKQIQRRVPLHSHVRLEALYTSWVLFWYSSNWTDSGGKSLQLDKTKSDNNLITNCSTSKEDIPNGRPSNHQNKCPNILYRVFVGCFYQPLDEIEKYYGEKVAFYFAWLEHCSFHLISLSVAGLIMFIFQVTSKRWDHELRPFFSVLVMIWSFVVMVTWRRRSNFLAYQWGTLNYQEEEVTRPDFRGTKDVVCPITNTYIPYYPPWKRWLMMCFSTLLTFGFTMLTLLGILILYGNRDVMLEKYFAANGENSSFQFSFSVNVIGGTAPILSVVLDKEHLHDPKFWLIMIGFPTALALILPLLNFCLRRLSLWLNNIENHRTEAEHQTHFIIKVFAFRFVCYFAALYYYSFIGVSVSGADDQFATEHGILRVASNLLTYLTIANWWSIFLQVFFPLLLYRWRVFRERLLLRNELRSLEMIEVELAPSNEKSKTADERLELKKQLLNRRLLLEHAQANIWEEMLLPEHDSFVDYLFAATQFAYVTCFSVVLPITPLIVLINHLLNMRLDAFKICRGRRRPLSQKTGGIGVWSHVLHIVTVLAILTNCSLMALTSSQFAWLKDRIGTLGVFALAIGWEHIMLLVKYIMQLTVSSMPASIQNEIKKKKYDQERTRYTTLRAKKERRSGSVDVTPIGRNDSDDKDGDMDKVSLPCRTSPCPPIRESAAESHSLASSQEYIAEKSLAGQISTDKECSVELMRKHDEMVNEKPGSSRRVVNVRATKRHSPLLEQNNNVGAHVQGSQGLPSSYLRECSTGKKDYGVGLPSSTMKYEENIHPNFQEAISKLPRQYSLANKSSQGLSYNLNSNRERSCAAPSSSARQGQQQRQRSEDFISPSSSLSTIPCMPTPCQLNLDSDDDDTLCTFEDESAPLGFYTGATAPPLSPAVANRGYGTQSTISSRNSYFDKCSDNDDDTGPRSKWGVHHFVHYAKSERSLGLSEQKQKKSR